MIEHSEWFMGDHVHQAVGMIAAQLDCSTSEALDRLLIRTAALEQNIEVTALDVLDGDIRFDSRS